MFNDRFKWLVIEEDGWGDRTSGACFKNKRDAIKRLKEINLMNGYTGKCAGAQLYKLELVDTSDVNCILEDN